MYTILIIILIIIILIFTFTYTIEHMTNLYTIPESCAYELPTIYTDIMKEHEINKTNGNDWTIYFPCTYDDITKEISDVKKLPPDINKKVFIMPGADEIASKSAMWTHLVDTYGLENAKVMSPMTYVLGPDMATFLQEYDKNKIYILKKNIQRQEGLKITNNKDEIIGAHKNNYVVVQELLQDPFIIDGRKTNMRFYVLLVCNGSNMDIYVYGDGFMYYTKDKFIKRSLLTGPNITTGYIEREVYEKNPLTHDDLRQYLTNIGYSHHDVFAKIYQLIKYVMMSVVNDVCNNTLKFTSFQLFGLDIALNDNLDPQIIECNKGPNLLTYDKRDRELKYGLIRDVFKVLGIINGYHRFVLV